MGNGAVILADGKARLHPDSVNQGTPYDLDAALQNGATIVDKVIQIGEHAGTSIFLKVEEK
jgi:hypothetical protein